MPHLVPSVSYHGIGPRIAGFLVLVTASATAAPQEKLWIQEVGTRGYDEAYAGIADGSGGLFVGGYRWGGLDVPSDFAGDAWIGRFDASGNRTWSHSFGSKSKEVVWALAREGNGGLIAAGTTSGGAGNTQDAWCARFDSVGRLTWRTELGSDLGDWVGGVTPDASGGFYVAGWTYGALSGPSAGASDAWLGRFDANGDLDWVHQFGTPVVDTITTGWTDGAGGVYVAGFTYGSLAGPANGLSDAWVARFDEAGNQLWTRQMGSTGTDYLRSSSLSSNGGVYIAGGTFGSWGAANLGQMDVWIAEVDANGDLSWVSQFGSAYYEDCTSLAVGEDGSFYVGGNTLRGINDVNAWVGRCDTRGNSIWMDQVGGHGWDWTHFVAPDEEGGCFAGGLAPYSITGGYGWGYDPDVWIARYKP